MHLALVNNNRVPAEPGLKGLCPGCLRPVEAKCGKIRAWYWSHRGKRMCDKWWEPETEWHRAWKDRFPREWQEYIHHDQSGEKHIADVRTPQGLIIEFQHSHLDPKERTVRERFYGNMVWVVDGSRLVRDYPRFIKGKTGLSPTNTPGLFRAPHPEECFHPAWLGSSVPVIFDFRGTAPANQDVTRDVLWCLLPITAEHGAMVACISQEELVTTASTGRLMLPAALVSYLLQQNRQQRSREAAIETQRRYNEKVRMVARTGRWRGRL